MTRALDNLPARLRSMPWAVGAALFAATALPLATIVLLRDFDGLYGRDSFSYYAYAVGPLARSLTAFELPPPHYWPVGYPALILLTGGTVHSALAVALVSAGVTAVLTYRLTGVVLEGSGALPDERASLAGAVAGGLLALTPQVWQSGIVVMADLPGLAFTTASALLVAQHARSPRASWALGAGLLLGAAIVTRWGSALLLVPWAVAVGTARAPAWRGALRDLLIAGAGVLLVAWPQLLLTLRDALGSEWTGTFAGPFATYSWNPARAFQREFVTSDGLLAYRLPNGLYYLTAPAHPYMLTPVLAPFAAIGAWRVIRGRSVPAISLLLAWPALFVAFHAGAPWQNLRFALAYLPPACALVAVGLVATTQAGSGRVRSTTMAIAALAALLMVINGWRLTAHFIDRKAEHVAVAHWVAREAPSDAVVLTFNITPFIGTYTSLEVHDLFTVPDDLLRIVLASPRPLYVLIEVSPLSTQWKDTPVRVRFDALRDLRRFEPLGSRAGYTLFRLSGRR